jgi:RecA-dependent nuclease
MTFGGKFRTKAEQARFDKIKHGDCMACLQRGIDVSGQGLVEVHHLLSGGRRIGHMASVGLCIWHHRASLYFACTHAEMRDEYGPSLAEGSKPFHAEFGSDTTLLDMQNAYLQGVS